MSTNRYTTTKAALLLHGQPQQPGPRFTTTKAALLHQGQPQQPSPRFPSAKAALLHAGQPATVAKQGFDWSGVTATQAAELKRTFDTIRKNDPYFDVVYRTLESQHGAYKFAVDPARFVYKRGGTISYGQFLADAHREHGGTIAFPTTQGATNLGTTNEEFFHAYQNYYYGRSRMERIGGSNAELEPRFMAAYKMVNSGEGFSQMPGQKRMFDLIMHIDEKATGLTPGQHKEYLSSVEEFRRLWEKSNRDANTNNLYDDPKTNDGPGAAFDLINRVRNTRRR